jgi:hypothetical protein
LGKTLELSDQSAPESAEGHNKNHPRRLRDRQRDSKQQQQRQRQTPTARGRWFSWLDLDQSRLERQGKMGAWIVDRESWIVDRESWIVDRESWIMDRVLQR